MNRRTNLLISLAILCLCINQWGCFSVPHLFWPQKDIKPVELNKNSSKKVLVASRSSEFKDALLNKIKEYFKDEPVYIKFIGLEGLKKEKGEEYNAVVMLNTCMSWDMDRNVKGFLKRHRDQRNMIVLTTSGDGNWKPKMKGQNFDAISAASRKENIDQVAETIITKIKALI